MAGDGCVELVRHPARKFGNNVLAAFDVAVPVVHGTNVEDGTLMGLLEMLNIPYASCDVTSSALGMDKFAMKAVLRQAGVPVLEARQYTGREYAADGERILDEIEQVFGYPVSLSRSTSVPPSAFPRPGIGRACWTHWIWRSAFLPGCWWSGGAASAGDQLRRAGDADSAAPRSVRNR